MKTKSIFQAAQDCWPEDEANLTADSYRQMPENGWNAQEQADLHAKNVAHMYKVFSFETDGPDLIRRYNAELVKQGVPVPAPFNS